MEAFRANFALPLTEVTYWNRSAFRVKAFLCCGGTVCFVAAFSYAKATLPVLFGGNSFIPRECSAN